MPLHYVGPTLSTGEMERSLIYSGIPAKAVFEDGELSPDEEALAVKSGLYEARDEKKPAAKPGKEG